MQLALVIFLRVIGHDHLKIAGEPMRGWRLWSRRAGLVVVLLGAGCSQVESVFPGSRSDAWYGYYYENVMVSTAPAMSKPFSSAKECLAAMRAYTRTSARWTGFACGRGCSPRKDGSVSDCAEVVH